MAMKRERDLFFQQMLVGRVGVVGQRTEKVFVVRNRTKCNLNERQLVFRRRNSSNERRKCRVWSSRGTVSTHCRRLCSSLLPPNRSFGRIRRKIIVESEDFYNESIRTWPKSEIWSRPGQPEESVGGRILLFAGIGKNFFVDDRCQTFEFLRIDRHLPTDFLFDERRNGSKRGSSSPLLPICSSWFPLSTEWKLDWKISPEEKNILHKWLKTIRNEFVSTGRWRRRKIFEENSTLVKTKRREMYLEGISEKNVRKCFSSARSFAGVEGEETFSIEADEDRDRRDLLVNAEEEEEFPLANFTHSSSVWISASHVTPNIIRDWSKSLSRSSRRIRFVSSLLWRRRRADRWSTISTCEFLEWERSGRDAALGFSSSVLDRADLRSTRRERSKRSSFVSLEFVRWCVDAFPMALQAPMARSHCCRSDWVFAFREKNCSPGMIKSKRRGSLGWTSTAERNFLSLRLRIRWRKNLSVHRRWPATILCILDRSVLSICNRTTLLCHSRENISAANLDEEKIEFESRRVDSLPL